MSWRDWGTLVEGGATYNEGDEEEEEVVAVETEEEEEEAIKDVSDEEAEAEVPPLALLVGELTD